MDSSGCCINPKTGLLKVTIGNRESKVTGCSRRRIGKRCNWR